jgi:peptide chain release factor subunit 1
VLQLDDIKQLLSQSDEHTLTVYLTVDPAAQENQAVNPAWRTWLKNALRGIDANGTETWADIRTRVEDYFAAYEPNSKGLVMFVGPDIEQVYELPVAFENQVTFGKAMVAPLLWAIDEYENYLVVMVDHEKARFFTAYLGDIGFQQELMLELDTHDWREKTGAPPSTSGPSLGRGSSEDDFDNRVAEHVQRFYRDVAARVEGLTGKYQIGRIILAGDEQSAHAVQAALPEKLAERVVGVMAIPMRYGAREIMEHAQPRALEYERELEMTLVNQVIDLAKSGGRGALGRDDVMSALEQQRVEVLVMPWPIEDSTLAEDLPERVFASSGEIELVHGEAAERLKEEGGLGARLYYAL